MTITVKLFDSMSIIVNISTDTALDLMFNLGRLGVMWYRSKLRQKKIPKTYLKRSNRRILQPGTHSRSTKKENRIASNGAIPASPLRMWVTVVTGTGVVKGSECCDWEQLISRGN